MGHGKSGTTWLARLLGSHPEVLCLWEGRFIGREWPREDLGEVEANVPPRTLSGAIANCRDLRLWAERSVWGRRGDADDHLANLTRLALDYFIYQRLAGRDKRIVGDKTPFLPGAHTVREIHAICPEARVIHVIRDGRDAEVSWMHHRWNRSTEQGGIQVLRPGEAERREAYRENPRWVVAGPGLFDEADLSARLCAQRRFRRGRYCRIPGTPCENSPFLPADRRDHLPPEVVPLARHERQVERDPVHES